MHLQLPSEHKTLIDTEPYSIVLSSYLACDSASGVDAARLRSKGSVEKVRMTCFDMDVCATDLRCAGGHFDSKQQPRVSHSRRPQRGHLQVPLSGDKRAMVYNAISNSLYDARRPQTRTEIVYKDAQHVWEHQTTNLGFRLEIKLMDSGPGTK